MKRKELLKELKGMSLAELRERAKALAEESLKLRMRGASGQLTETHRLREVKRGLARVMTFARKIESAQAGDGK